MCDAAESKQSKFLPGSHVPIFAPEKILNEKPDFILVLPWNLLDEVRAQLSPHLPDTQFVVAVPELRIDR